MLRRIPGSLSCFALLLIAGPSAARAHHAMEYALPATALEGLLSGLGHPVIGLDHFLFVAAAGVLAANFGRGWFLPLLFVAASVITAGMRYLGTDLALGEFPVAGTLVVLGAMMLAAQLPREGVVALLFIVAGTLHGHALAEAIVGAERTPLAAYLLGLAVIQSAVALAAWRGAVWAAARHPGVPLQKLAGAAAVIAGVVFSGFALAA